MLPLIFFFFLRVVIFGKVREGRHFPGMGKDKVVRVESQST